MVGALRLISLGAIVLWIGTFIWRMVERAGFYDVFGEAGRIVTIGLVVVMLATALGANMLSKRDRP